MRGHKLIASADNTVNDGIGCITKSRGIVGNDIKNRLNVSRRAGDYSQDLTRRSLLLQRLLELIEQPYVFDGDDGLVRESLKKLNLRRGEGVHLGAPCEQSSNEFPLLTKGSG